MRRITNIERTLKVKIQSLKLPSQKEVKQKNDEKFLIDIDKTIKDSKTSNFLPLAEQLLEKHDANQVISALLNKVINKTVSSNRSSSSSSHDSRSKRGSRGSSNDYERVFIAKGKMDRMDNKSLIRFIEKETRVRISRVKDIKVCDKFSFITMKSDEANDVVDAFESKGRRRPLAEIAQPR